MRILEFWINKEGKPTQISGFEYSVAGPLGLTIAQYDPTSYEGEKLASQYNVHQLPAIIAVANSGMVLQSWFGYNMPTKDQLKYYIDRGQ